MTLQGTIEKPNDLQHSVKFRGKSVKILDTGRLAIV